MTPEDLDMARAAEAWRIWTARGPIGVSYGAIAARLAREGWTPPTPVDPLLIEAREIAAQNGESCNYCAHWIAETRAGENDNDSDVLLALAGIKRGIEIERAKGGGHD